MRTKTTLLAAAAVLALGQALPALADFTGGKVRIGVLNDQSSLYADITGRGSVVAAQMAVEDFGGKVKGAPIEVTFADHQNKPDVGSNVARQWYDTDGVDVIVDVPTSSVALAINEVTREKNKVFLVSGAATSDLTGAKCSPNTVHWTYDTWALANGTGSAIVQTGGDSWFFLTADYAFGHALERDTAAVVTKNGGKVLGAVRHPLNNPDFSSYLLQAQGSKAKIIGLANAGGDTINSIKQAAEFGIVAGGQNLAGLLVFISDVHGLGLQTAQGLILTESFYWDLNDSTRAWSKRFAERMNGRVPTMVQAGVYAAVTHYLKALDALGADGDGKAVVEKMKAMPTDDPLFGKGEIRKDGRKLHPMYLFEVKKPAESKGPWDYYKLKATIPADKAFRPLAEGNCPLAQ
ncbi:MAG: ABC transporter substrate-binding protein [Geminicoccaceae bacterium]|nr:ABC transporter substrate-binding protein [Geminicoccaceae bacterium]MCX8102461.1 ABC transporter substrate-binding protein [Geminicoccaceae bacterium]MDW8370117.1 ABC transporter substrate-binding protein [Geminicoccaceae bacterium]